MIPTATKTIGLMIQVNGHRHGNYCGRCGGVHISDLLDIEPVVLPEPRCTLTEKTFSLHRTPVKILAHWKWVGNFCWDEIRVSITDAARLLRAMFEQKYGEHLVWGIDCAHGEPAIAVADRIRRGENLTVDESARLLETAE